VSGERPTPPRPTRAITYFVPREGRRRWPVAASGAVLLGALVAGQVAVAASAPAPPVVSAPPPTPTAQEPTLEPPPEPTQGPVPTAEPEPTPDEPTPEPTLEPVAPPETAAPEPDLREVDPVTISFTAGAVLDEAALEAVAGLADVLATADAAPVVVVGYAEPGPDEAVALRLATSRAEAVVAALVDLGVPAQLLRVGAVVDGDAGRTVVVGPDRP
jgi:outer membrane protein OmpA-like peptidoglycan-associated protein